MDDLKQRYELIQLFLDSNISASDIFSTIMTSTDSRNGFMYETLNYWWLRK